MIQEYLDDETVSEIMINGTEAIFVERDGNLIKTDKTFSSKEKLEDVIQQMVGACNRTVNEAFPIADARLASGERINVVLAPVALNGPIVTIRRFPNNPITMERLIKLGSLTEEAASFLQKLVKAKYNIFISGGTGTGKTTFLNALSMYIPPDERILEFRPCVCSLFIICYCVCFCDLSCLQCSFLHAREGLDVGLSFYTLSKFA